MKRTRDILTVVAIAGAAFMAGRLGLPIVGNSSAKAQDHQHDQDMEMPPQVKAMIEAATPGEFHKQLENLIGEFDAVVKIWDTPDSEPMIFTGTVKREWILGGRFIKEIVKAQGEMGPFEGLGFIGYNNIDGQYESIWMESISTAITTGTGSFNPDKKEFFVMSKNRDPFTHKLITKWNKIELGNSSRQVATGWQTTVDGRDFKNFEGVFERK